jgi:DNA-binding SARP family transcriptional activator
VAFNGEAAPEWAVPHLRVGLLGGFTVQRADVARPVSGWQRRTAKTLTKLLATTPGHALHRDQILEILWPDVDHESALNSFAKGVHAARRAFEPELLPRESSAYLRLTDAMLALDTRHVVIDADNFEQLAEDALKQATVSAYELALASYGGELLPEDRYEDWTSERRTYLAELRVRLLLAFADALEDRGAFREAADRLHALLQQDPTREDVHRRLIRLYAELGTRDQAARQFHACRDVLRRELGLVPARETVALYEDVLANRIPRRMPGQERRFARDDSPRPVVVAQGQGTPLVGRQSVLRHLREQLVRAEDGRGSLVVVGGEAGVGKTRVVAEFAGDAARQGARVLWGGSGAHADHLPYGPFALALEAFVAACTDAEREELAQRHPSLLNLLPSLGVTRASPPHTDGPADDRLYLVPAIVRMLADLARTGPVAIMLGDLQDTHPSTVDLLQYVVQLAVHRRWLLLATLPEEGLAAASDLRRVVEAATRERVCIEVDLQPLPRPDCDELVCTLLGGGRVDGAVLDHVAARSRGNPMFAEELVGDLRRRDELVLVNGSWQAAAPLSHRVPDRVRAMVEMRVEAMVDSVRRVLALVAAGGPEMSLADLRASAAALQPCVSEVELFDALDRALKSCILEELNGAYAFRHPLVRAAVYEDLSKHRRDQLEAAVGRPARNTPHRLRAAAG